jgi:glycosyltransferase involved in cell wall biosynthesis
VPRNDDHFDVLVWASVRPDKHGSFEDFLLAFGRQAQARGHRVLFAVARGVSEAMAALFRTAQIKYREFSPAELSSGRSMFRAVRRHRCRFVHVHFVRMMSWIFIGARLAGAPHIFYTAHFSLRENEYDAPPSVPRTLARGLLIAPVERLFAVSHFLRAHLTGRLGLRPDLVLAVHNGIDLNRYRPCTAPERATAKRALFEVDGDVPVVSFIGQMIGEKGVGDLFKAQQLVARARDDAVRFVYAGEGGLADSPALRRPDSIYLGRRDDIDRILNASDVLVAPSRWHEAFGLTIAEAAASGVPVVASARGGIPEIVEHELTGYLIDAGDHEALAQRIGQLLADDALRERMGRAARARAEQCFDIEHVVARVLDAYDAVDAPRASR